MRDEVKVLVENFSGQKWERNRHLQTEFYKRLAEEEFFTGTLTGELDFKARDRITRAPKSLGLVNLSPQIALTEAGEAYLYGPRPHEIFTRQLLKFQLPSPYHVDKGKTYWIRPYLELLRLIDELETLSKNEIAAFVTQLVHFRKYDEVKEKIRAFREAVKQLDRSKTRYNRYFHQVFSAEILNVYAAQINTGNFQLRESRSTTLEKFIGAKKRNHLDYADAAIRYLRETRLVSLTSGRSNRLYIPDAKREEVAFILENTPREPQNVADIDEFKAYLFDASLPLLYTDDQERLIQAVLALSSEQSRRELLRLSIEELKNIKEQLTRQRVETTLAEQINRLELYEEYDDITETYRDIIARQVFDAPLMLEWNTWRAFVMLDDGRIIGNFRFDDTGMPLSTAPGNQADILCQYDDFDVLVEVTLTRGARQYEAEGEPVARHSSQKPTAVTIKKFVEKAAQLAEEAKNEQAWYDELRSLAANWVS